MIMASKEQLVVSDFIKWVHEDLRKKSKILGPDEAWKNHRGNEDVLVKYAKAMKELSGYWEKNYNKYSRSDSRIIWTYKTCVDYFYNNISSINQKEKLIAEKIGLQWSDSSDNMRMDKLKLLDVGSCYNAFKGFSCFEIIAIDIAPAVDDVLKCDFLDLLTDKQIAIDQNHINELPRNYFDIVVFSLFLEYLPCADQRQKCCEKAYGLLKHGGLLIIISPDSNHANVNAKHIKSWRFILARIGFFRIKYEKLSHIHCMAFRKAFSREITLRWLNLQKNQDLFDELFIPQDFNTVKVDLGNSETLKCDDQVDFSCELPFYDSNT